MSKAITELTDEELQAERTLLEQAIQAGRASLRALAEEAGRRHRINQIKVRYGDAGVVLLETLGVDGFHAKLAELIKAGKIQDRSRPVAVSGRADVQLTAKSPSL